VKVLTKEHGVAVFDRTGVEWDINAPLTNGWDEVTTGSFVSSTYFDLAGMSMEEKTLFFEAAGTQSVLAPTVSNAGPGDSIVLVDIMTAVPLTNTQAVNFGIRGNFGDNPPLSYQETIYARVDQWVTHVDTGPWTGLTLTNSEQLGSMMPTASDRVYSYRVILFGTPFTGDQLTLSSARHILQAKATEEADHTYMMRLLRSYQLQQSYDED
jgi:hypothetical protein